MATAATLAASLLAACTARRVETRDEGSQRIEDIIGRPESEEPIPEGLAFTPDTASPPISTLASSQSPEPRPSMEADSRLPWVPYANAPLLGLCTSATRGATWFSPAPPACVLSPGAIRFHIAPRPGGSIPGLLP
ncbi:hypothetical protein MYSTI_05358 [Myxococcus stipitatus DSM 14675]|uniref:Uncharacterized protein n=1 Tax=Myxococcus stipitatus (strain DSM 14675 / JCM 12634 / Mx s8) TaxID=1278073 RepID=L7UGC5_MYXSD|nr:hypothetical protein [Myxococcus stipitatus]AGC46637.1 hypothetical protein MYSTI_05358 [Myxococcus stipitatus DSM 14675]